VGVEVLHDIAEQQEIAGAALLFELECDRRLDDGPVEFAAVDGGEACRDRT